MTQAERRHRLLVVLCFTLVYLLWGSTYLAISIAVEHIPPALYCASRFTVAGIIMLAYCTLAGRRVRYTAGELGKLAIIGVLLLTGGNAVLAWAEQYVPSGLSALIVAAIPLWFLVIDTWIFRGQHLSRRGFGGLLLGIAGVVVLLWPDLAAGGALGRQQLYASLGLLGCAGSWALGSVLSKRWQSGVDAFTAAGWQMTLAGMVNLLIALGLGEQHQVTWTAHGLAAIAYLVVCGSLIAFTAYIWLLEHVPTSKVATYAYVNPVVAVFLGWLIRHERVDRYILAGSVIVLAAVVLVTGARLPARGEAVGREPELPAVETTGD